MKTPGREQDREFFTPGSDLAQKHSYLWALAHMKGGHKMRRICWSKSPAKERRLYVQILRTRATQVMSDGTMRVYRPSIDTVMFSSDWDFA